MKLKKLLASILCVAMVLSTMSFTVFAEATVHNVSNDTELAEAIKTAVDGDTIKLAAGEYAGGISVGKEITFEGAIDENGNPTTVFSGNNSGDGYYQYSIYMNKGTIKNIKIVDAWKGIMTEGKGSLTIDNVTIVEAGYGIHIAEAKSAEDTVLIQNCNIDITWANSFAGGEYAIVMKNNVLTAENPYYGEEYGANLVNTFVPNTTIEDNIFGENAKILVRDVAKDGVEIGSNYYADGFENALSEDCAEGVKIETYYADIEMTEVVEAPKGTITPGYTTETRIWGEGTSNSAESFVVELYAGDVKIAQASLKDYEDIIDGDVYVTWGIPFNGEDTEYWDVEWYDGNPVVDIVPTKVVLLADGVTVAENEVQMNAPDNLNPVEWDELENVPAAARIGEKGYGSLEAAFAATVEGDTITMYADAEISEATAFDKAITIDLNDNTLNMTASHGTFSPSEPRITAYYITAPVTIQNGTVNVNNDVVPTGMDHGLFFVVTPGALTFDNVELNSDGFASYAMFGAYGELEFNNSTVNVKGNEGSERVIYSEEPGSLDVVASSITATDIEVYGIEMWAPYTIDEYSTINTTFYVKPIETNITNEVKIAFEATDDQRVYNIYVEAAEAGKTINRLSTVQGTFALDNDRMSYTLAPVDGVQLTNDVDTDNVYVFNFDGENAPDASGAKILIGTVTFGGYGEFNFTVTDGKIKTALLEDNIVSEYIPNGDTTGENDKQGNLDLNESVITGAEVAEAKRDVKVVISFYNELSDVINGADYNDMTVTITGSNNEVHTAQVGDIVDGQANYTAEKAEMTFNVTAGYRYTVVVKGEGYRTARYSTTVDAADDTLVLNFWNNAKDEVEFIEEGVERSQKNVTFLAGDIAQDNIIDKYDLAAVVSYFGFDNLQTANPDYVKYDLNRDGKIDADDISYVLVSWGK